MALDLLPQAGRPVFLGPVPGLADPVAVEDDDVTGLQIDELLVVGGVVEGPERQPGHLDRDATAGAGLVVKRVGQAGVREERLAHREIEEGEGQRAEEPLDAAPAQRPVGPVEEVGRRVLLERPGAHRAGGEGRVQRRRHALARDVADGDAQHLLADVVEVVQVAAQLARRPEVRRRLPALPGRVLLGEEAVLDVARDRQLAVQAHLAPHQLVVEPRVLDRDRHLARERRQHLDVLLVEAVELGRLQVEHADHAVLGDQRDHELGARLRDELEIARVLPHVRHQDGLLGERGGAAEALAERNPRLLLDDAVADGLAQDQLAALLVQQQDAEHLVVDHPLHHVGHAVQQLVEVEDGGRLLADLVQRGQEGRVPLGLAVEGRVLDGERQVARQHLESGAGLGVERALVRPLDVEDAHQPVAVHERDRELGPDPGRDRDVARVLGDVLDEHGLPRLGGGADDALTGTQPETPRDAGVVPDEVRGRQRAVRLGQEDVEDAVVDEPAQQAGDRGQELVRVQDGRHLGHDGQKLFQDLAFEREPLARVTGERARRVMVARGLPRPLPARRRSTLVPS